MKIPLAIIILILGSCQSENKTAPFKQWATDQLDAATPALILDYDSLIIQDDFADHPFHSDNNLSYFNKHLSKSDLTRINLSPNQFDSAIMDTIKTTYWNISNIQTIQNKDMDNPVLSMVYLEDNDLTLKNEIRIGDAIEQVFSVFNTAHDSTKKYKFLLVETPLENGATSSLYFYFHRDSLREIVYLPYLN